MIKKRIGLTLAACGLAFSLLALVVLCLAVSSGAQAYDEFTPRGSRGIVQEQRGGVSDRPPLMRHELIVKNRTSADILSIYAKSNRMRNLSVDLLPGSTISPRRQGLVNLDDGYGSCEWYIRVEMTDNRSDEGNINVCTLDSWTVTGY